MEPTQVSDTRKNSSGEVSITCFSPAVAAVEVRKIDKDKIRGAVRQILEAIGEDPDREGLLETPDRVARMFAELTAGTGVTPESQITCEFLEEKAGLVLVRDINFSSTCEHHMLPFTGVAHVAYLPRQGRITGLSKLARVVEIASKRLQVQERLNAQIADAIQDTLDPLGVFVMIEAVHSCMVLRGIKKPGSKTITMDARGVYRDDKDSRNELLTLLSRA